MGKKLNKGDVLINTFLDIAKEWYAMKNRKLTPDAMPYDSKKYIS